MLRSTGCQVGGNQLRITTGGLLLILLLPREPQTQKLQLSPLVSNLWFGRVTVGPSSFPFLGTNTRCICCSLLFLIPATSRQGRGAVEIVCSATCRQRAANGYININKADSCSSFICRKMQRSQIGFRVRHKQSNLLKITPQEWK